MNFGEKRESRAWALLAPAGESLEHNTLVAAGPNLCADGAFSLPLCILQRVDLRGVSWEGGRCLRTGFKKIGPKCSLLRGPCGGV